MPSELEKELAQVGADIDSGVDTDTAVLKSLSGIPYEASSGTEAFLKGGALGVVDALMTALSVLPMTKEPAKEAIATLIGNTQDAEAHIFPTIGKLTKGVKDSNFFDKLILPTGEIVEKINTSELLPLFRGIAKKDPQVLSNLKRLENSSFVSPNILKTLSNMSKETIRKKAFRKGSKEAFKELASKSTNPDSKQFLNTLSNIEVKTPSYVDIFKKATKGQFQLPQNTTYSKLRSRLKGDIIQDSAIVLGREGSSFTDMFQRWLHEGQHGLDAVNPKADFLFNPKNRYGINKTFDEYTRELLEQKAQMAAKTAFVPRKYDYINPLLTFDGQGFTTKNVERYIKEAEKRGLSAVEPEYLKGLKQEAAVLNKKLSNNPQLKRELQKVFQTESATKEQLGIIGKEDIQRSLRGQSRLNRDSVRQRYLTDILDVDPKLADELLLMLNKGDYPDVVKGLTKGIDAYEFKTGLETGDSVIDILEKLIK